MNRQSTHGHVNRSAQSQTKGSRSNRQASNLTLERVLSVMEEEEDANDLEFQQLVGRFQTSPTSERLASSSGSFESQRRRADQDTSNRIPRSMRALSFSTSAADEEEHSNIGFQTNNLAAAFGTRGSDQVTIDIVQSLKESNAQLKSALTKLEEKVLVLEAEKSSKRRIRLPPELSRTIAKIHDALSDEQKLKPNLRESDNFNAAVKARIIEEILRRPENMYCEDIVKVAVSRYFQSRKRLWRESMPEQKSRVLLQAQKRKSRSRKYQLYCKRQKYVQEGEEATKWADIDLRYMSEEESNSDSETLKVRQPHWRSPVLSNYLHELDKRHELAVSNTRKFTPPRKRRYAGTPLKNTPPKNAPTWTMNA